MSRKPLTRAGEDRLIARALSIVAARCVPGVSLSSPAVVREYLMLKLAEQPYESFYCVWLDSQNCLIAMQETFVGTISQTSVYPREIVRHAVALNASSVIFAHNHPSGTREPSRADEMLTETLKAALRLVDCRVVDHFVVAGAAYTSLAERGLL